MKWSIAIVLVLILGVVGSVYYSALSTDQMVGTFEVATQYDDQQAAADRLAAINNWITALMRHLKKKYLEAPDPSKLCQVRMDVVKRLFENYNPELIKEHVPTGTVNTSFVRDKNKEFGMCLRDRPNHRLHDMSTLIFVAAHEISHMANAEWGHPPSFWRDFKIILEEAKKAGLYDPINYSDSPMNFCGLDVTYNPYYDKKLHTHD